MVSSVIPVSSVKWAWISLESMEDETCRRRCCGRVVVVVLEITWYSLLTGGAIVVTFGCRTDDADKRENARDSNVESITTDRKQAQ